MWSFESAAIAAVFGRFYIRLRYSRPDWDDFFNGLALISLTAWDIENEVYIRSDDAVLGLKLNLSDFLLLWTTLYLIKASFLALYWKIFNISSTFRMAWWTTAIYTFLTFWPIVFLCFMQCGNFSDYANPTVCDFTDVGGWNVTVPAIQTALHASSDCLLLALPLVFLHKLHISKAKRLGIAAILGISILDLIMGIIRNIDDLFIGLRGIQSTAEYDLQKILQVLEPHLAVIVCAVPAYGVLLRNRSRQRDSPTELLQNGANLGTAVPRRSKSDQNLETSDTTGEPTNDYMV